MHTRGLIVALTIHRCDKGLKTEESLSVADPYIDLVEKPICLSSLIRNLKSLKLVEKPDQHFLNAISMEPVNCR